MLDVITLHYLDKDGMVIIRVRIPAKDNNVGKFLIREESWGNSESETRTAKLEKYGEGESCEIRQKI